MQVGVRSSLEAEELVVVEVEQFYSCRCQHQCSLSWVQVNKTLLLIINVISFMHKHKDGLVGGSSWG